uniref:TIP_N domain-containing protein n=1 Tax=Syphacia muris TaxID=451379 RepID=A0A0N5ADK2_9BILA
MDNERALSSEVDEEHLAGANKLWKQKDEKPHCSSVSTLASAGARDGAGAGFVAETGKDAKQLNSVMMLKL